MSTNSIEGTQKKEDEDRSHIIQIDTTTNHTEDTDKENENKTEIVVKIEKPLNENKKTIKNDADLFMYGYQGQNQVLPTTWVYFQQGRELPEGAVPLDYTPDRNAFVRLVFTIVFIMIIATAGLNTLVLMSDPLSNFFKRYGLFCAIAASILVIGLSYAMALLACTRVMPWSGICLFLTVLGMTTICCFVTVRYDTRIVLLAVMATAGVVLVCVGLACTSFDFTKWLLYVIVIAAAFGIVSLVAYLYMLISGNYMPMLHVVFLCIGTVINVIVLIMELQMILGGKAVELSENDYAVAAFMLYTSIIDIFLKLVQIMGILDNI